jgi:hypothetical protein
MFGNSLDCPLKIHARLLRHISHGKPQPPGWMLTWLRHVLEPLRKIFTMLRD